MGGTVSDNWSIDAFFIIFYFFFLTKFNNNKLVHIKKNDTNYTLYTFHNPLQTFYF